MDVVAKFSFMLKEESVQTVHIARNEYFIREGFSDPG
jgi:hypothetical protein